MSATPIAGIPTGGEIAVLGLARSGVAAAKLLARRGYAVYASDASAADGIVTAAEELTQSGVHVDTGGHDLDRIGRAALVVVSPGIPPHAPPLARARAGEVRVISEVDLALRCLPGSRVVAVTGTNGKSTTTAMIGRILEELAESVAVAGNIGRPLAEVALLDATPAWIALELSSFQLHDTPTLAPAVGVLTNLSPDHLDRYATVDEYYQDKALLFANATPESVWITNADDADSRRLAAGVPGTHLNFSLTDPADAWMDASTGRLCLGDESLMPRDDLPSLGQHNVANALAAALAVTAADAAFRTPRARERVAGGLRNFLPLAHRLEPVGVFDEIIWVNDSKATNVGAARVALEAMYWPTVLLLGGRHKGESYAALVPELHRIVKTVIAYGEAAPLIEQELAGDADVRRVSGGFEEVVAAAAGLAEAGDAVLLSPACSSYDMFTSFEERGDMFRRLVLERFE